MHNQDSTYRRLIEAVERLLIQDHPSLIYENREELLAAVVPFIRIGLERGERCLFLAPKSQIESLLSDLSAAGIDTTDAITRQLLYIPDILGIYRSDGKFDPDRVYNFLDQFIKETRAAGLSGFRLVGDMTWPLQGTSGMARLIEYESRLDDYIRHHKLPALCVYDRARFPADVLLDVIRTHPKVIFGNMLFRSCSSLPPEEFFVTNRADIELDRLLQAMQANQEELSQQKEANSLLNSIFANTTDAVYVKDLEGRYLLINKAGADFIGKSEAQVRGRDDSEFFPPDSVATIRDRDHRAMETGTPCTTEEVLIMAGVTHTYLSTKGPYRDAQGNVIGVYGIARDITERKAVEQALLESEAREKARAEELDALMEAVPAVILISRDPEGRLITGSRTGCEFFRVPRGGNLSKKTSNSERPAHYLICRDGIETPVRELPVQRASRGEEIRDYEQEIVFDDGSHKFLLGNATPLHDRDGNLRGAVAAFVDITERKRIEHALRASEEQFRILCDFAPIGIFRADYAGNNTYVNPRWEEIMEMSAAEGMGRGWNEHINPADRADILRAWLEATAARRLYAHECRIITHAGKTKWIRALGNPLTSANGEVSGYVGTLEDVTTMKLAGKELLKSEKLESLGLLAGGIAHDFNNFLTAILGNISLARLQLHNPEMTSKRLLEAEKATIRAKDLTQQLLTFARGGEPVRKVIDIGRLLKNEATFALHGAVVGCIYDVADDLWPVDADEGQLSQVIHNLVINAMQAMPNGGKVTIGAKNVCSALGERFVKLSVADTGIGIPESYLQRIFDPYFTTKQQGSGLGLATSHSIITKHGGKLRVTSTLGTGSEFAISLPAADHELLADSEECVGTARGSGSILVMDDEESVRDIARAMLEELGYTAESVADGSEAVALYRQRLAEGHPFNVVIMDLTIPGGIGGREAIHMLRAIDPEVKVVVSSGYSTDPVMANFREHGFSSVLVKPYRMEEIGRVLGELIGCFPE